MSSNADVAGKVQKMYTDALKQAKVCLKKNDLDGAFSKMAEFFDHQDELAEYFHHRNVDEVKNEMMDRLEQARSSLASILAEYPDRAKQFLNGLKSMVDNEFEAFASMKQAQIAS